MEKRLVFRRDRKTATEGAEVMCSSRLFQTRAAATGKVLSPMVDAMYLVFVTTLADSVVTVYY